MTKAQLKKYRDLCVERNQLLDMLTRLESVLYGPRSVNMDGMPHGAAVDTGRREAQIARHDELKRRYELKVIELETEIDAIEAAIDSLPAKHRTLCRLYYIEGRTWAQVCGKMNYSWSQIHRIHGEALQRLKEVEYAEN